MVVSLVPAPGVTYRYGSKLTFVPCFAHHTTQIVQLLIERGCQFTARNNDGFTASDYAYS